MKRKRVGAFRRTKGREHLRAPPRGYEYRRDERGDLLTVAIASGLIASIIASN